MRSSKTKPITRNRKASKTKTTKRKRRKKTRRLSTADPRRKK